MITLILLQLTKKLNTQSFKLRWVKTWNSTNWPNTLNKRTQTVNMYQQQNQFFLVTQITGTAVKQRLQQIWLILSITFYTKCQWIMQKMFHFQQILSFYFNSLLLFLIFFIIHLMPSITKNVFVEIMELFSDQSKSKRLYKKAQSLYLMKSYKITNVSAEQSIQSYDRLQAKYTSGQLQVDENDWHKNQRKLFIWFLICYCQQRKKTIQELEDKEWDQMSEIFFGKNQLFLKFQGLSILKNTKRHNWIIEDDQLLQKFVQSINSKQWNSISKAIFFESQKGRFISAKQCRERWFNHICKQINKDGWTQEEDIKILKMTLQIGKKWSRIARQLETHRTEHMVKNRFNSIINKIRRKKLQNELSLTRKALSLLEQECKEQKQEELNNQQELDQQSQNKEQEEMQQQGGENKQEQKQRLSIPIIPKVEQREQTSIRSDAGKKISKQTEDMQQYNLSELPQGEIKGLQNLINKKQKGCFSFNPDESQAIENLQPLILSMTPSSVKGLSPGFSNSFLASIGDFIRKQDGSGFISPAPQCFSPGPGGFFQSFSPGFQNFFSALDREKNGLSSSRECISFTPIPMQLSSELKLSGHLAKKQGKQGNQ